MESDTMMIDEPMCCLGCGEPYSATGWVDVIDLETMTAGKNPKNFKKKGAKKKA